MPHARQAGRGEHVLHAVLVTKVVRGLHRKPRQPKRGACFGEWHLELLERADEPLGRSETLREGAGGHQERRDEDGVTGRHDHADYNPEMSRIDVRTALLVLAAGALAACAETPSEPTSEMLDETTGVTVARLAQPIELLVDRGRGASGDPFAYLAPFETNRMGERALFLWTATPEDPSGAPPVLLADGEPIALAPMMLSARDIGLSSAPYQRPAPWSVERLYRADRELLERLARAGRVELIVRAADGTEQRYTADAAARASLLSFVADLK